jgi:acyl-CoA synthetase (AMP-forming)/AMP-acid ligase II/3-hydroxymyristoyl/3-hydroxydecanoyl-(acyl carrier protein) dehydratase
MDLWGGVAAVAAHVESHPHNQWVLYTESIPCFLTGFFGLLHAEKEITLPANMQPGSLREAGGLDAGILDETTLAALTERGKGTTVKLAALDPGRAVLRFHTSGSVGSRKIVSKLLFQLERDVENLHAVWGADLENRAFYSSVSHQHIYGFLFSVMLPLCMGQAIASKHLFDPDALSGLQAKAIVLVLSPAFLKRAVQDRTEPFNFHPPPFIFCGGGVLPGTTANAAERIFATRLWETYGSTETGGIAYRGGGESEPWRCFPGINIRITENSGIEVQSPYLREEGYVATGDAGRLVAPGAFTLLGRLDSIVKIEEKRVALDEVENRLRESPLVEDVYVLALEQSRQFLAAVVVLSAEGRAKFTSTGRRKITANLRSHLKQWFEPTTIPRKWRYREIIPRDTQGKVLREAVIGIFERGDSVAQSQLPEPTAVERDGDRLDVRLSFPPDSVYFDGHFPSFRLLPGVVQLDCVMRLVRQHLGIMRGIAEIPRLKFSRPIFPDVPLVVEIEFEPKKDQIQFRYLRYGTKEVFSSGKLKLEKSQ